MEKNTYIECPSEVKKKFLKEAKDTSKGIGKLLKGLSIEGQLSGYKAHLPVQIQIQMVKAWHEKNNQKSRFDDLIQDKDLQIDTLKQQVEQLKRQIK